MNKKPIYYSQLDSRWKDILYTMDKDPKETIGASGCGPTSVAMILATWIDPKITPIDTCHLALDMGDRTPHDGTAWSYFGHVANKYKLGFLQTANIQDAIKAFKESGLVVCSMSKGYFTRNGHFILAYDCDRTSVFVNDPASNVRTHATIDIFLSQCREYFIFRKTQSQPTPVIKKKVITALNIRTGPATTYNIILTMPVGSTVVVLNTSGEWDKVQYGNTVGWASNKYLVPILNT